MSKTVSVCVIVAFVAVHAVNGDYSAANNGDEMACIVARKIIWKGDVEKNNDQFKTENFNQLFDIVCDLKGQGNIFSTQDNNKGKHLPKIVVNEQPYELKTLRTMPLENKVSAVVSLTFAYPSAREAEKTVLILVPLVDAKKASPNHALQKEVRRIANAPEGGNDVFDLKWLLPLLNDVVAAKSGENKQIVFITRCQKVLMWTMEAIMDSNIPPTPDTGKRTKRSSSLLSKMLSCFGLDDK